MQFFEVFHDTFKVRGAPWVPSILRGLERLPDCPECGAIRERPAGEIGARVSANKRTKWMDVLGCGAYPLLIISDRVLETWRAEGVGVFPSCPVVFDGVVPERLATTPQPTYSYLRGREMQGATLDLEQSGYVIKRVCGSCGRNVMDIAATDGRQNSTHPCKVIWEDTWTGAPLFTTNLSPTFFLCTELIVASVKRNGFTNFIFKPCVASRRA